MSRQALQVQQQEYFIDSTFSTATITARGCMIYNDTNSDKFVATIDFADKPVQQVIYKEVFPAKK